MVDIGVTNKYNLVFWTVGEHMINNREQHNNSEVQVNGDKSTHVELDFGKLEGKMPKMYSDIHQPRAENSLALRNWLRNENFEIGHLKGFFKLNDKYDIFEQDLTVGFVAYLFNMEENYISYEQWVDTEVKAVEQDGNLYRYINIMVGCGKNELSKTNNFFIHEWEGNQWFQEWVGYDVDWSDWIGGPKQKK